MIEEVGNGKCYFCGKDVTPEDFCYGCHVFVCDDCDIASSTGYIGKHEPEHHQQGPFDPWKDDDDV